MQNRSPSYASPKAGQQLLIPAVFGAAVTVHVGANGPLHFYISNLQMFSFSIPQMLTATLPSAALIGAVAAVFLNLGRRFVTLALARIVGWLAIFLIFGFQFGLFVGSELLDGQILDWSAKWKRMVLEVVMFFVGLYCCLRLQRLHWARLLLAAAIFIFLNSGLSLWQSWPVLTAQLQGEAADAASLARKKDPLTGRSLAPMLPFFATYSAALSGMDAYSQQKNIVMIVVDTLQSDLAEEVIKADSEINNALAGFVFYRNSAGIFPFTGLSIPAILSGEIYKAGEPVDEYFGRANERRLDRGLREKGFETSYLGIWARGDYAFGTDRARSMLIGKLRLGYLYRQVPLVVKPLVFDRTPDFLGNTVPAAEDSAAMDIIVLRRMMLSVEPNAKRPQFKFVHLWGVHQPSSLGPSCNIQPSTVGREGYLAQARCVLSKVAEYLAVLRRQGVYSASQIFILADHGTTNFAIPGNRSKTSPVPFGVQSSAHPTILFKDYNRTGALTYSDVPVSLLDIRPTILQGAGIEAGNEGGLIAAASRTSIKREFFYYKSAAEMHREVIPRFDHYEIGPHVRDISGWSKR